MITARSSIGTTGRDMKCSSISRSWCCPDDVQAAADVDAFRLVRCCCVRSTVAACAGSAGRRGRPERGGAPPRCAGGWDPFTAYIFPETIKKPVLSPLRMASGSIATRGFPPEPRPEERADHPHHVGLWFNYGDVNGLDSWNHSDTVSAMRSVRMGTVLHRRIRRVESGRGEGVLEVTTEWVNPQGQPLLREDTRFVFHAGDRMHGVDRITTLTVLRAPPGA